MRKNKAVYPDYEDEYRPNWGDGQYDVLVSRYIDQYGGAGGCDYRIKRRISGAE
jgi:hypothetical protein